MNHCEIEYQPLSNVVKGLTSYENLSPDEVRTELIDKGYDLDAFVAQIERKVCALSTEFRLSWMQEGDAMQTKLNKVLGGITSWAGRASSEVNQAFDDLLAGRYGSEARLRVQTAFKNVTALTTESKAAFLDEVAALMALRDDRHEPPSNK